jgi:hypothetical protein
MAEGVDLTSHATAALVFWHRYTLEPDHDSAWVELLADTDTTWHRLGQPFTNTSGGWVREIRDLTNWCGASSDVRLRFRLMTDRSVDDDGWYIDDVHLLANSEITAVVGNHGQTLPKNFNLSQNYPNPFNPSTDIRYQIGDSRFPIRTTLKIYNVLGQEVRTLVDGQHGPGAYTATWDGRDNRGLEVSSGVYLYRLQAGDYTNVKRMILLR